MPVPPVDPRAPRNALQRGYIRFARSRLGRWLGINLATRVDPWLLRKTGGRFSIPIVLPIALLTTRGARTGIERVNPVVYMTDGDDVVVVASSFGRENNPGWYYNLRKRPDCELWSKGQGGRYRAEEVDGPERDRLWELVVSIYPGYEDYRLRAAHRTIPVMRLTPAELAEPPDLVA